MPNSYILCIPNFTLINQQPLMKTMQPNIHENKFDGNKRFNILIPIQPMKKNPKMKRPFEIRDGDWTCSDCSNLNFSFRIKCNRCGISKESSDKKKQNNINNDQNKEYSNQNNTLNNNNKRMPNYPSINMIPYKGVIFPNPLYTKGEMFFPKYYPRYIYVPTKGHNLNNNQNKTVQQNNANKDKEGENNEKK